MLPSCGKTINVWGAPPSSWPRQRGAEPQDDPDLPFGEPGRGGCAPNLPTKIVPAKIAWLELSVHSPRAWGFHPLKIKILLEPNPLKSRILVRRFGRRGGHRRWARDQKRQPISCYSPDIPNQCILCDATQVVSFYAMLLCLLCKQLFVT